MASKADFDNACMRKALENATLSTCPRRHVGAILTSEGHTIGDGYNGAPKGEQHCSARPGGCELEHGHCVTANHAEINAVMFAWTPVWRAKDTCLYCTTLPCRRCMNLLLSVGIKRIVFMDEYRSFTHHGNQSVWTLEAAARRGIEVVRWMPEPPDIDRDRD